MIQLATFFVNWLAEMGSLGVFLLIAGESMLLPLPSEIILPFAGFLAYSGKVNLWLIILISIIGQLVGSIISYGIGYYGGRPFVLKYGRYFLLNKKHFEHVEKWFQKYGAITVFIGRLLPIVRTIISFPAGITKINFKKFLFYSTLGIIPWSVLFIYIGFRLGEGWTAIINIFDKFQYVVIAGIIAFIIWWIWKEKKERHEDKTNT